MRDFLLDEFFQNREEPPGVSDENWKEFLELSNNVLKKLGRPIFLTNINTVLFYYMRVFFIGLKKSLKIVNYLQ